jgi:hypothetical protein
MRPLLFAVAAAALLAPAAAPAADPPIVFQAQPLERVLGDLRAAADLIGGEKGVKAVNKQIDDLFGEKGLEGLDIGRPIVGYVVLAPKPEDITVVVALPVTGEKEFLDLCKRLNKQNPDLLQEPRPSATDKDLYELLPPLDTHLKGMMRFSDQYAYIAYGKDPAPHLDRKALVPMPKLYDPADPGLISARLHFDRVPLPVKLALPGLMDEVKKNVLRMLELHQPGEEWLVKPVMTEVDKLLVRYARLAEGADVLTARLSLDVPTANVAVEAVLTPKPNSDLAGVIAAIKPTTNKFAGLLTHPDTAAGFKVRLPLFEEEIRAAAVAGLEAGQKDVLKDARDVAKPTAEELFKGLIRTVKTGEFDIVGAVRGPDKNGSFTAVGAIAFEDPSAFEKAFKTFAQKDAPPEIIVDIKWDADKAGNVSIHTWKLPAQGGFIFGDITKVFGGDDCSLAFAFASQGVFLVLGPDAVGTMKEALAVKPAASPVLEVLLNPAKIGKFVQKVDLNDPEALTEVERRFGIEDKLLSAMSATLEGGQELKAKVVVNLRLLPRAMFLDEIERIDRVPAAVPVEKK